MAKIFIDGKSGTTGLRIYDRLASREGIDLITIPEEHRHDAEYRREAIAKADVCFFCLPDDAARESAALAEGTDTVILDTSTAHRTSQGWCYGFPELSPDRRAEIAQSKRIAVPGCHASGFIALVAPLVEAGIIPKDAHLASFSLTGYSGGGKKMIAQYEDAEPDELLAYPRQYGLTQSHKHLPEMVSQTGLKSAPAFIPVVDNFYSGMEVTVPLFGDDLGGTESDIRRIYADLYAGDIVRYVPQADEAGFLSAGRFAGKDSMEITVCGSANRLILCARYDNLGKGASGAAIQCMNLALGFDEADGLEL